MELQEGERGLAYLRELNVRGREDGERGRWRDYGLRAEFESESHRSVAGNGEVAGGIMNVIGGKRRGNGEEREKGEEDEKLSGHLWRFLDAGLPVLRFWTQLKREINCAYITVSTAVI